MSEPESSVPELSHERSRTVNRPEGLPEVPSAHSPPVPVSRRSSSVSEPPGFVVGHPPNSPSPLAIRASNSPSSKRRKHLPKPPVNLRLVDYVSQVDDNLVCLICHCPFDNPLRVVACDHVFCKECLQFAFAAQDRVLKNCPTCRTLVERDPEPVQRLLTRILDELHIKCPNHELGCNWQNKRIDVQDHIELYCEYTMIECPDKHCDQEIMQKDFHKGCLHQTIVCQHCHTSMMKKDLEKHEKEICPNRFASCPHCSTELTRYDLPSHVEDDCLNALMKCPGHVCGCSFEAERNKTTEHLKSCPMAIMAPTILAQKARQDEQDKAQKLLQRKVDLLESTISAIQPMLYPGNPGNSTPVAAVSNIDPLSSTQPGDQALPPFDSHILSLHESLREEMSRTANAIADLDGRMNMLFLNEQQRNRDDMLHVNTAISTMRMQLHWLISSGRHQAYARATAAQASPGGLAGTNASGSSSSGPGRSDGFPPFRRLSDSSRQDTKL